MTALANRLQVNIPLEHDERDTLDALAFLNGCAASEALRPLVKDYLDRQRSDPDVVDALQALHRRRARKAGKLTDLRKRTSRGGTQQRS